MTTHTKQPLLLVRPIRPYLCEMPGKPADELSLGRALIWVLIGTAFWTGLAYWVLA